MVAIGVPFISYGQIRLFYWCTCLRIQYLYSAPSARNREKEEEIIMRFRKTRQEDRGVYRYQINVPDGKGGYRVEYNTIKPGEKGVTELVIKSLHGFDDSEVYYNVKNSRRQVTSEEKLAVKEWEDKHQSETVEKNWNLSIESLQDQGVSLDKSKILASLSYLPYEESNPEVDRLYEVMESMTDKQRQVLSMVKLEERTLTEVAHILGTSIPNIKKHLDKALEHIKDNYYKK